jgi:hypothetical protein
MTSSQNRPEDDQRTGKSAGGIPNNHPIQFEGSGIEGAGTPGSSQGSPDGRENNSEEDDMEEQLLYLRLMALRSMATDLEVENETVNLSCPDSPVSNRIESDSDTDLQSDDELVNEMTELLDEADRAANDKQPGEGEVRREKKLKKNPVDIAAAIEKLRRANSSLKQNSENENEDVIIPCQHPNDVEGSPISLHEPEMADSDSEITIVGEIENSKAIQRNGRIKVSDFARVKPQEDEDDIQIIEPANLHSTFFLQPPNCEPVDMELSCENEAEIQFFKDQVDPEKQKDALFPPSVWQIGALLNKPPPPPPPLPFPVSSTSTTPRMSDVMNFESDEARYEAFFRAVFSTSSSSSPPPAASNSHKAANKLERKRRRSEEVKKSSLIVLTSPSMPKKPRASQVEETKAATEEVPSNVAVSGEEEEEALRANLLISMIEKRKRSEKQALLASKPVPVPSKTNAELLKLNNQVVKLRHFPNLFKQFLIPVETSDDEEEIRASVPTTPIANSSTEFSMNLEKFLKDVRQKTAKKKATPPPKPVRKNPPGKLSQPRQPPKKLILSHAVGNKSSPKSLLSNAIKTDLMTSTVSHLPAAKQAEYKQLKELIAKKERDKQLQQQKLSAQKAASKISQTVKIVPEKSNKPTTDVDEEVDEDALRAHLLASLQRKTKKVLSEPGKLLNHPVRKRITAPASNIPVVETSKPQPGLVVSFANSDVEGPRDVQVSSNVMIPPFQPNPVPAVQSVQPPVRVLIPVPVKNPTPTTILQVVPAVSVVTATSIPSVPSLPLNSDTTPSAEEIALKASKEVLKTKESDFAATQQDMIQEIYKLSAQMSQLKGETKVLEAAESFAKDLRRQLAETELVIIRSRARISQLKTTVTASTMEIGSKRPAMVKAEEECKKYGTAIYGPIYKPPQSSASQMIKKKLAQIKETAETLVCNNNDNDPNPQAFDKQQPISNETLVNGNAETLTSDHQEVKSVDEDKNLTTPVAEESFSATSLLSATALTTSAAAKTAPNTVLEGSSLAHLRSSQVSILDPHTQLCRFELLGKCNDDKCKYQHHTAKASQCCKSLSLVFF